MAVSLATPHVHQKMRPPLTVVRTNTQAAGSDLQVGPSRCAVGCEDRRWGDAPGLEETHGGDLVVRVRPKPWDLLAGRQLQARQHERPSMQMEENPIKSRFENKSAMSR